jgi:outer membrane protein TolC
VELTLPDVVDQALSNYPSIRVSSEQVEAAAAAITLARTAYVPRTDFVAQANRATRNNIYGLTLPQPALLPILPAISGPPRPENSMASAWGTVTGFLVAWEPFDFGLRRANVNAAEASRRRADATVVRTRFDVAVTSADAYLTALAAEQTLKAAQAQLERAKTIENIVGALTRSELRPGADLSRSQAEVALAEIQVEQAQTAIDTARTTLRQLTGKEVRPAPGKLLDLPVEVKMEEAVADNPYAREQQAAVAELEAQRRALDFAYYPRFHLEGSTYARGTGVNPDGTLRGGAAGLGPNIVNWAAGITVTFPIFDLPSVRAQKAITDHRRQAESARYDQILVDLNARLQQARERLENARRVAALLPRQLEAARAAERQATARYQSGLGTLIEVADAQRLLSQTEIEDSLARLSVWRSMLGVAAAGGDLNPFLNQVK